VEKNMELKKIKKTAKELEVEIIGENETILNPIAEVLLQYDEVDYASCMSDHPESNKRRLYIRVKKGDPINLLNKAIKHLEDEVTDFSKKFDAKVKSKKK
jgi:DNA-directed RNA polymerase subunit L